MATQAVCDRAGLQWNSSQEGGLNLSLKSLKTSPLSLSLSLSLVQPIKVLLQGVCVTQGNCEALVTQLKRDITSYENTLAEGKIKSAEKIMAADDNMVY